MLNSGQIWISTDVAFVSHLIQSPGRFQCFSCRLIDDWQHIHSNENLQFGYLNFQLTCIPFKIQSECILSQFYRYSPTSKQRRQFFKVPGVQCDQRTANNTGVTIHSINKQTAGLYKCQVTIEATFKSVSLERRMEVVANSSSDQSSNKQQQSAALPGGNRRGSPNQHHQHHKSSFLNQEAQSQHATNSRNPNHHSQRGLEPEASSGANLAAPESSCSLIVLIILVKSIEFLLNYDNFSRNPNH